MKSIFTFFVALFISVFSFAQETSDVTFSVDMSFYSGLETLTPDNVFVNGEFNGWCGDCNVLTDEDGDFIYTGTLALPNGVHQFKYTINGWADEEVLADGSSCTINAFGNINRVLIVDGFTEVPTYCFSECSMCDGSGGATEGFVTFSVDMNSYEGEEVLGENSVYINGVYNGWCGDCNSLSDPDGDGVYVGTFLIPAGFQQFLVTVNGWNDNEIFVGGEDCTIALGENINRIIEVNGDGEYAYCYNSCEACGEGQASGNVTFSVNMSEYEGEQDLTSNNVFVNGIFNGWCGDCNPMTDDDGDMIYEVSLPLPGGYTEYKFTVNGWSEEEMIAPDSPCAITVITPDNTFVNRTLTVDGDETLATPCFNFCNPCGENFEAGEVTFAIDMSQYMGEQELTPNNVFVNGLFNGWCGDCNPMSDEDGDMVYEVTLPLPGGYTEYKYTINGWTEEEMIAPDSPCAITVVTPDNTFVNRTLTVDGNQAIEATCFSSCDACIDTGIEDLNASIFNVSPNPTTGIININSTSAIQKIEVRNTLGELMLQTKSSEIDLSNFNSGLYFISSTSNGKTQTQRIIKK